MKNFKRLVAGTIAATMALAMSVSAFADATIAVTSDDATYENGVAKLNTALTQDGQLTVIIIDKDKENAETLSGEDLYYINQGDKNDNFWIVDGMGTKVDLATTVNETTTEKNYIIRIGGTNISDVIEYQLKATYTADTVKTKVIQLGDANLADGVGGPDINAMLDHIAGITPLGTVVEYGTNKIIQLGDANLADGVGGPDINAVLDHISGVTPLGTVTIIDNK